MALLLLHHRTCDAIPRRVRGDPARERGGARGLGYEHIAALGGLRKKAPGADPETNAYWDNQSFHNYADYTSRVYPFELS